MDVDGPRPAIVFIHGLGCAGSSHFSRLVAEPEIGGYRRVAVDLLGHGYSDRPDEFGYTLEDHAGTVVQLLDHLGLERCVVFGHSMGGAIAITLTAERPDLVSQLILAEPNLSPGGGFVSKVIASQTAADFHRVGHEQLLDRLASLGFLTSVGSFRICSSTGLYRSAVGLVEGIRPSLRETLHSLDIPRAFLIGERSLPDPATEELPKHGIDVHVIPAAGHDMTFDNPSAVAQAIQSSLRSSGR